MAPVQTKPAFAPPPRGSRVVCDTSHDARQGLGKATHVQHKAREHLGNGGGGGFGVPLTNLGVRACHDAQGSSACALDLQKKRTAKWPPTSERAKPAKCGASHVPSCSAEITQDIVGNLGY